MNGTDANEPFHKGVIKVCMMEKSAEDAVLKYARFNRCPRCDAARLQPLGELKTERGPIGILVCGECEFGVYVESTAAGVEGSAEQRARDLLDRMGLYRADCAGDPEYPSDLSSDDVAELANLIADNDRLLVGEKVADKRLAELEQLVTRQKQYALATCTLRSDGPAHPGLDIVKDKPPELVIAARILARALDRTVYLTQMRSPGVLNTSERPWTITIEKDGYGSEVAIEPDGSALECDVWT